MATFTMDHINDALQMIKDNCKFTQEDGEVIRLPSCGVGCSKLAKRAMDEFNFRSIFFTSFFYVLFKMNTHFTSTFHRLLDQQLGRGGGGFGILIAELPSR